MQNRSSFRLAIGVRWYRGYQGYGNFAGTLRRSDWQFVAFCRARALPVPLVPPVPLLLQSDRLAAPLIGGGQWV
jgi:hypothetical protein